MGQPPLFTLNGVRAHPQSCTQGPQSRPKSLLTALSFALFMSLVMSLMMSGCATLLTDPVAELLVESEPQGAEVYMRGRLLGRTPLKVFVSSRPRKRQREYVYLKKEGFQDSKTLAFRKITNPYLFGNLVFTLTTSGLPSSGIDKASGHSSYFASNAVVVELSPKSTAMEPPLDSTSLAERRAQEARRERKRQKRAQVRERIEEERRLAHERAVIEAQKRAAQEQAFLEEQRKTKREAKRAQDKERLEREAKARAQREALETELKASREKLKKEQEAKDKDKKAQEEREAIEAQLKEAREALERERAALEREREALKKAREALSPPQNTQKDAPSALKSQPPSNSPAQGAQESQESQESQGSDRGRGAQNTQTQDQTKKDEPKGEPEDEQIDELERRLLKRLREQQRRLKEAEEERRGRGRLTPPQGLPLFELTPIEGALLSPSWGALSLSIARFNALTLELATLSPTSSPLTRSLFLRLWGAREEAKRSTAHVSLSEDEAWPAYLRFIERASAERVSLLSAPHGLALYRALRRLAFDEEICHSSPTLSAERASPRLAKTPSALLLP